MTHQEIVTKRIKAGATTLIVAAITVIMMILMAWGMPGQGSGDNIGIEVNLGDSPVGSGNDQPLDPGTDTRDEGEPQQAQSPNQEEVQEPEPQEASQPKETDPAPVEPVTTSDEDSDVEIKKDPPKEVKPIEKKVVEKPKEKPEEKKVVEKTPDKPVEKPAVKEEKKDPAPVVDTKGLYKKGANTKTDGTAAGKQGQTGNEGNDAAGTQGDKGVPGGTPGASNYEGTPGGGTSGSSLELKGWDWDKKPEVSLPSAETGRIEFEVTLNVNGELIGVRKLSGSLSAAAESECLRAIRRTTFSRIGTGTPPERTVGKVIFVARAR